MPNETDSARQNVKSIGRPELTVVTPAYDEAENLPILYERLSQALDGLDWEWLIVDDHSGDGTFAEANRLSAQDERVRGIRLARNSGTHSAARCGLDHARGSAVIVMASDLQDPPEIIPSLVEEWRGGAQVVWAVRSGREGESTATKSTSRLYHWIMRRFVGITDVPVAGADFFLVDRIVVDALSEFRERHGSILMLITWLGYRQVWLPYTKEARLHGRSKWTLEKKLKLFVDSILSFSYRPIRFISYFGITVAILGLMFAMYVVYNAITGAPTEGWSSLMVVVLVLGGIQMVMIGVLGEYTWRALDEARQRPAYTVEAVTRSSVTQAPRQEELQVRSLRELD
jgi:dolichol-phosphate mannosyltransferase